MNRRSRTQNLSVPVQYLGWLPTVLVRLSLVYRRKCSIRRGPKPICPLLKSADYSFQYRLGVCTKFLNRGIKKCWVTWNVQNLPCIVFNVLKVNRSLWRSETSSLLFCTIRLHAFHCQYTTERGSLNEMRCLGRLVPCFCNFYNSPFYLPLHFCHFIEWGDYLNIYLLFIKDLFHISWWVQFVFFITKYILWFAGFNQLLMYDDVSQ